MDVGQRQKRCFLSNRSKFGKLPQILYLDTLVHSVHRSNVHLNANVTAHIQSGNPEYEISPLSVTRDFPVPIPGVQQLHCRRSRRSRRLQPASSWQSSADAFMERNDPAKCLSFIWRNGFDEIKNNWWWERFSSLNRIQPTSHGRLGEDLYVCHQVDLFQRHHELT